jgi:hypothetical protein
MPNFGLDVGEVFDRIEMSDPIKEMQKAGWHLINVDDAKVFQADRNLEREVVCFTRPKPNAIEDKIIGWHSETWMICQKCNQKYGKSNLAFQDKPVYYGCGCMPPDRIYFINTDNIDL